MSSISIGTASWADPSLIRSGQFYPPEIKSAEDRLRFYSSQFDLVEVDTTYYGIPSEQNSYLWAQRTPADFTFNVKAFKLLTDHPASVKDFPKDLQPEIEALAKRKVYYEDVPDEIRAEIWTRFREALRPLWISRKLGVIHFQFAPWVIFSADARAHIEQCVNALPDYRIAVEFRNKSWFGDKCTESTLAFEREHGLVNVVVDEPQGHPNSIPAVWEVTSPDLAIVRLHGRNRQMWNAKGLQSSADRFNYEYSAGELEALADPISRLRRQARKTHVLLNNCHQDKAQRNAAQLRHILDRTA